EWRRGADWLGGCAGPTGGGHLSRRLRAAAHELRGGGAELGARRTAGDGRRLSRGDREWGGEGCGPGGWRVVLRSSPPVAQPMIQLTALAKRYGSFTAVAGIDLTVPAGELFGFLGPNGAGKTTTL